jgi:iron complex outermembrane receptor protein
MLNSRKSRLALIVSALGAGAAWVPQASMAQAALEEVIVTAQKRDETLQDVPITITALTAEKLEKSNFTSVNDLPAMVPALRIDQAGAFSQPTVRGVGSSTAGVGFSSNIATYVDGFYVPSQATTNMQLINLQGVEVLKGPQGTLFGRNATGGAILLTMLEPSSTPTGKIRASYGSYNTVNLAGYGSSGVTDSIAADVSVYKQTSDGFVDNIYTGKDDDAAVDRWGVRVSAVWDVNDDLSFKLAFDHHDWDDSTPNATGALDGQATAALLPIPGIQVASSPQKVSNDGDTNFFSKIDGVYLTARASLTDNIDLVSYTMGRRERTKQVLDLDSSSVTLFHNFFNIENDAFSQEFNLSGSAFDDRLDWIVGLYYLQVDEEYTDLSVKSIALAAISPDWLSLYNVASKIDTYAAFTDMTYSFTDEWMLTLGARYSHESADGLINIRPVGAPNFNALLGLPTGETDLDDSWGSFTPRAVLAYKPDMESKAYFSVSKGFKAGQISPSSLLPVVSVEPENILAYELGYKYAESTVRFSSSVFYYDYKDMQVASYNAVAAIVSNAASSSVYGAEAQLSVALTDEFTVNFGAAYVKGEYDEYETAPFFQQQLDGSYADVGADASGNQMQRSPEFTGNLGLQYETALSYGTLRLNGDYYYTSKFYFDPANQNEQDAYGLLNLSASWIDPGDAFTVSVYSKNVTDEEYRAQILPGAYAIQQTWGEPVTYGVSVSYKY